MIFTTDTNFRREIGKDFIDCVLEKSELFSQLILIRLKLRFTLLGSEDDIITDASQLA